MINKKDLDEVTSLEKKCKVISIFIKYGDFTLEDVLLVYNVSL